MKLQLLQSRMLRAAPIRGSSVKVRSIQTSHKGQVKRVHSARSVSTFVRSTKKPVQLHSATRGHKELHGVRKFTTEAETVIQPLSEFREEEKQLRDAVKRFAEEVIKPKVKEMDKAGAVDPSILSSLFEQGFMGIEVPSSFNGSEASFASSIILIEELSKVDPAISNICLTQNNVVNTALLNYGTTKQKEEYLPKLTTEYLGSFCVAEKGNTTLDSPNFAFATKAEEKGDHYILNGVKSWISNAKEAGLFIVFANLPPSSGKEGITAFLVEKGDDGITVGNKEDKMGMRACSTAEVTLKNCKIPKSRVLGKVAGGEEILKSITDIGRIAVAAQMLGLSQGALESTLPYLYQRKQFGQPIGTFQGMQFTIAQNSTDIEAAKLMTYNATRLKENGLPYAKESKLAKHFTSQLAERVSSQCINMLGGVGFTKEFPAEKYFRDCKFGQIVEGTANVSIL